MVAVGERRMKIIFRARHGRARHGEAWQGKARQGGLLVPIKTNNIKYK